MILDSGLLFLGHPVYNLANCCYWTTTNTVTHWCDRKALFYAEFSFFHV